MALSWVFMFPMEPKSRSMAFFRSSRMTQTDIQTHTMEPRDTQTHRYTHTQTHTLIRMMINMTEWWWWWWRWWW